MLAEKLQGAVGNASNPVYVEDVFSTYLYTGNGTLGRTITNGIDLSTKGGMVWVKNRSAVDGNGLFDTNRGVINGLQSDSTGAENTVAGLSSVTTTGYVTNTTSASYYGQNKNGANIVSWTFRKQAKFFDVVTFTTAASGNTTFNHNLGSTPGCVIIKNLQTSEFWSVYHRSIGDNGYILLNTTAGSVSQSATFSATDTDFTIRSNMTYASQNYVAYLFAHNAGGFGTAGTDNVISCGSYTEPSSGTLNINLGYEVQWLLTKSLTTGDWVLTDVMQGMNYSSISYLKPNSTAATTSFAGTYLVPNANGFTATSGFYGAGTNIIYIAIRRGPMKTPTDGTTVFTNNQGSYANNQIITNNIGADLSIWHALSSVNNTMFVDRLRGYSNSSGVASNVLYAQQTSAEDTTNDFILYNVWNDKFTSSSTPWGSTSVFHSFKRAPGFFDEVCYTGDGTDQTLTHNLGVTPELAIFKKRNAAQNWNVLSSQIPSDKRLILNTTGALDNAGTTIWNATATTIVANNSAAGLSGSGSTYLVYLFATLAGVSKIGTYTGTGTVTQTINAGFGASGARWVMIKRTDSTGNWYVFNATTGMTSSSSPYYLINTNSSQTTGNNGCYAASTGFTLDTNASATVNINGASYIYLAIA